MDFKASCGELVNIGNQLTNENRNIVEHLSRIKKVVEILKNLWNDGSSELYCKSLLEYIKSVSQLIECYEVIGSYAIAASEKYERADENAASRIKHTGGAVMDIYYDPTGESDLYMTAKGDDQ